MSVRAEQDWAEVDVAYANGISAQLRFRKEADGWKFDLSHHLEPAVRILGDTYLMKQAHDAFKEGPS